MPIIESLKEVQSIVGKLGGARDLKVIDHADEHARTWLAHSPLAFFAFGATHSISITLAGSQPGFVSLVNPQSLRVPAEYFDDPDYAQTGASFGSLYLIPGLEETLRLNGRVTSVSKTAVELRIEECYLHCAKALIRSDFWGNHETHNILGSDEAVTAMSNSTFMALATMDAAGQTDVSPKGDPAGALLQHTDNYVWYPDRPGNRRIDSFRNILAQPHVALLAITPGGKQVISIAGQAAISDDIAARQSFTVANKTPKLVTRVTPEYIRISKSSAMERVNPWPVTSRAPDIKPAEIFKAHVKLSKERGLGAGLARAAVTVPGLMQRSLESDYKKNLY